uniref:Uncharacterized protein LOC104219656 n=1 Tax=Nicotiana sylvestris TaxID=4096 RepID=A0A1U7VQJ4_NICSY|nr:PREDICTED: uncharacterized protein LOC104219656 [Nicotiana sylvestris]
MGAIREKLEKRREKGIFGNEIALLLQLQIGTEEQSSKSKTEIDVSYPYFLSSSDPPVLNLINTTFDGTSCGAKEHNHKMLEDQKLIQFFMGLNKTYNAVRGNVLMMKHLPTTIQAYSVILHQESQREEGGFIALTSEPTASANLNNSLQIQATPVKSIAPVSSSNHLSKSSCLESVSFPVSVCQRLVCLRLQSHIIPAAKDSGWKLAMEKELDALESNRTWSIVTFPEGKKALTCKWIYKVKLKSDGSLERLKARLVITGDTQREVKRNWKLYQLDVNNAFLHSNLDEEIYMHFLQISGEMITILDDILITGNNAKEVADIKHFLNTEFKIKDLGEAALHTLRYLCKDPRLELFMSLDSSFQLVTYCDSDWAACSNSRCSVSGFFLSMGDFPISWKLKKQQVVALSSAEAEYRLMRRLVAEITWVVRLLQDLTAPPSLLIPLHCDNLAAIHRAKNPIFHERTKHIELDCHFIREKLLDGLISLSFVPSSSQIVDIFTKALSRPLHRSFMGKLGVRSGVSNLRGGVTEKNYFGPNKK